MRRHQIIIGTKIESNANYLIKRQVKRIEDQKRGRAREAKRKLKKPKPN